MLNKSRRTFLKGAAYTSALAVSGLAISSAALANDKQSQQQTAGVGTEVVYLVNHTASVVTFDSISSADNSLVSIAPGEQKSFVIPALNNDDNATWNKKNLFITDVLLDQLAISSDYPKFNGIVPITEFATLAA